MLEGLNQKKIVDSKKECDSETNNSIDNYESKNKTQFSPPLASHISSFDLKDQKRTINTESFDAYK